MSRHISNAQDISPTSKKWTVLVQVLESGHVQQSRLGNDYKRLILADSHGTKVTALIYSSHLRYFARLLTQYKRYYISNATVTRNDERYRIGTYTYSWVLSNKTLVEELVENTLAPISCHFEFTNFSDLHKYADSDSLQNVRAIVLQCFPSQEQDSEITSRRDVVIVNEEKRLLLLTLWNQYDEKEGRTLADIGPGVMIFGMRLKVTTEFYKQIHSYSGLSLTTRGGNSGFMINPPVSQELQMQEWYNGNREGLQQLLEQRTYRNSDILLPYPQDDDVISIASFVASWRTLKSSWIKGRTTFPRQDRSLWYTACANCQKSLEADLSWIVTCPSCHQESELEAISRLAIRIDDGTANLSATICSADAEKLIPFNATQLRDADEHECRSGSKW
ncbi:hypothetical protein CTI12_AA254960 [Artemisia annua]|uniref:Replication protein A 70 kDa DNA-binding subunit B/D first OB fold domain-containing protein n=1 Tax=Artemisia annua TaxID=35608 RepID=A0A2U1NKV4_ARTAN|nr:hypothetical protein CTI12_AA254960 [Artemisia annua]